TAADAGVGTQASDQMQNRARPPGHRPILPRRRKCCSLSNVPRRRKKSRTIRQSGEAPPRCAGGQTGTAVSLFLLKCSEERNTEAQRAQRRLKRKQGRAISADVRPMNRAYVGSAPMLKQVFGLETYGLVQLAALLLFCTLAIVLCRRSGLPLRHASR